MTDTDATTGQPTKKKGRAKTKGKAQVTKDAAALERLKIEYVPIAQIRANSYNPNRQSDHDFDLLKRSITEDGFTQPIVAVATANAADPDLDPEEAAALKEAAKTHPFTIVDGEHRWRAADALGYTEIPVAVVPMTLAQARIATLRHNRARGSEDMDLAVEVLKDLDRLGALDWAADSLQLDDAELDHLLNDIPAPEALAGEEFSEAWEPAPADTSTRGGDIEATMTPAAIQAERERETKLAQAKTDEERQTIKRESDVYRVACIFSGDEGKLVKDALGDKPAETILEWCREKSETK